MVEREIHKRKRKEFEEIENARNDVFHIAVCGKFNVGKTSLLNLLLDLDLPVKAVTATGIVTKIISHGSMSVELEDGSRKNVSKSELDKYITIVGKDLDEITHMNAVSVDVPCNSPLMMDGKVEFWDTPGLEDDERLTRITLEAIRKCDMAVMVMDAAKILSQKEKLLLYQMQEILGGNVLVVLNRWDMIREDEKPGIKHTAEAFLKKFGNDCCGYGQYLLTSANPNAVDIDSLHNRIYDICGDNRKRLEYINQAHSAKIRFFAREWDEQLERDTNCLKSYLESCQSTVIEERNKKQRNLEEDYRRKKEQLKNSLTEIMCKVDERSYWVGSLNGVKSTAEWEKQYVRLSTDIMKKSLQEIYQKARKLTGDYCDAREYPECYPLPTLSEDKVWDKMEWGWNFNGAEEHQGGMWAGIAAGAAVGSVIPGVGTAIGAGLGVLAGVFMQDKIDQKNEQKQRQVFKNVCIDRTMTAFYKEPATIAKIQIQNYQDELFRKMEAGLERKRKKIEDEITLDGEYNEVLLLLDELQGDRKRIACYL